MGLVKKLHKTLRKMLVEEQKLDAIVSMPSGVFRPYAGVSTAILLFTKTNSSGTDNVWFYDMHADGFSLDDKRTPQPDTHDDLSSQHGFSTLVETPEWLVAVLLTCAGRQRFPLIPLTELHVVTLLASATEIVCALGYEDFSFWLQTEV